MPTKGMITEQVRRRLNGGNISAPAAFKDEDIALALGQSINKRLKADYLGGTLQMGETIPEGSALMTYEGDNALAVVPYSDVSMAVLPARPVKLMRDLGIFHVSRDGDHANPFIPTQPGQRAMYQNQPLSNDLLGQICYEPNGDKIVFDQDITAQGISKVMVKLIMADVFSLGDYDPLPITADMEADIVTELVNTLGPKPPVDKIDDPTANKITP